MINKHQFLETLIILHGMFKLITHSHTRDNISQADPEIYECNPSTMKVGCNEDPVTKYKVLLFPSSHQYQSHTKLNEARDIDHYSN